MAKRKIVLIVHNVRSAHNVGSLLRTAEGFGVNKVYLTGYTPYPVAPDDKRLPHIRAKLGRQIHKTALGAEDSLNWSHHPEISALLDNLRKQKYLIVALEQAPGSQLLPGYRAENDIALIVGSEVGGLSKQVLKQVETCLEIPMLGKKESFNVAVAAAIALYQLRYRG